MKPIAKTVLHTEYFEHKGVTINVYTADVYFGKDFEKVFIGTDGNAVMKSAKDYVDNYIKECDLA